MWLACRRDIHLKECSLWQGLCGKVATWFVQHDRHWMPWSSYEYCSSTLGTWDYTCNCEWKWRWRGQRVVCGKGMQIVKWLSMGLLSHRWRESLWCDWSLKLVEGTELGQGSGFLTIFGIGSNFPVQNFIILNGAVVTTLKTVDLTETVTLVTKSSNDTFEGRPRGSQDLLNSRN